MAVGRAHARVGLVGNPSDGYVPAVHGIALRVDANNDSTRLHFWECILMCSLLISLLISFVSPNAVFLVDCCFVERYGGKCIALCVENFYAEVVACESNKFSIDRNQLFDQWGTYACTDDRSSYSCFTVCECDEPTNVHTEFDSMLHFMDYTASNGFYGGQRILRSACFEFSKLCKKHGAYQEDLMRRKPRISYSTTIPVQVHVLFGRMCTS